MGAFAMAIRRTDLLDDECETCGWSRWMGTCGCKVRQTLAEVGEELEEFGDPCGHRRGACSCEADDLAYFKDEDL